MPLNQHLTFQTFITSHKNNVWFSLFFFYFIRINLKTKPCFFLPCSFFLNQKTKNQQSKPKKIQIRSFYKGAHISIGRQINNRAKVKTNKNQFGGKKINEYLDIKRLCFQVNQLQLWKTFEHVEKHFRHVRHHLLCNRPKSNSFQTSFFCTVAIATNKKQKRTPININLLCMRL